jgi:hypothetical protein
MKKINVYTPIDEGISPKCIGTLKDGESTTDLIVRLEEKQKF